MTVVIGSPGSGAGRTTLQQAYDNDPTDAQILLNNVPDPVAVRAAVAGDVFLVQDLGSNNILQVTSNPDLVEVDGALAVVDAFLNGAASNSIRMTDNVTYTAPFIGGGILSNGTVGFTNQTWVWALLQESKVYQVGVNPAFAAFTLFNALAAIENDGNFNLVQAIILNCGVQHRRVTSGTSTTQQTIAVSQAASTRANVAGATMTKTVGDSAVRNFLTFSTVLGSTVNFGTVRGLWNGNPTVALFATQAGVENMTAYVGVEQDAVPFGGNVTKRALRSALTAATNTLMIENTGGAASDFGAGGVHFDDSAPVQFGGAAFNAQDVSLFWAPANYLSMFFTSNNDDLRFSCPAANRFLIDNAGGSTDGEYNFNCSTFSLGAQTGANGNQVGNFVTPARTIGVAGEWADFLLTQGGNLTVGGLSMSRVSAWVINGVSYANSTGTVTEADTLTVGGFPTSSPGVTITDRQSLHVIGGRSRFDSVLQVETISPAALGAGDNNDWAGLLTNSPNNNMRQWARVSGNATTSVLTGIDSTEAQDGDWFTLTNISANTILVANEDTGSSAANRIITPDGNSYVLSENRSCDVRYDATSSRWRVTTPPAAVATLAGEWQFDNNTTMADPGNGNFRNNNATIGSVTAIAISDETKPGSDAGGILAAIASGDQLYIQNKEDANEFLVFDVTSNTDNTGWHQIGGTVNASGSNFTDGKEFLVTFIFA